MTFNLKGKKMINMAQSLPFLKKRKENKAM